MRVALFGKTAAQTLGQYRPTIEEAQAGANFHEDRLRWHEADVTTELVTPGGEFSEKAAFGIGVAWTHIQCGTQRTSGGEGLAAPDAEGGRFGVGDGDQALAGLVVEEGRGPASGVAAKAAENARPGKRRQAQSMAA